MLLPKKVKHRKWQKGRSRKRQIDTRGTTLSYGSFGLRSEGVAWISSRHIEAARRALTNFIKREGKIWIRIFPDKPVTERPTDVTMGGGKGNPEYFVFPVRKGRILFEMDGVPVGVAKEALRLAGHKLPVKTKMIVK